MSEFFFSRAESLVDKQIEGKHMLGVSAKMQQNPTVKPLEVWKKYHKSVNEVLRLLFPPL